jgi:uncharacterized protein (UPF0147 family)
MNVSDFTYLLQYPEKVVSPIQTNQLDDILDEFPYFQAARAIQLKGLKNLNSFKYNSALKNTAAYTADREVLFDFITSEEFLQNSIAESISGKSLALKEREIFFNTTVSDEKKELLLEEFIQDSALPQNIKEAEQILDPALFTSKDPKIDQEIAAKKLEEINLEIGSPLSFAKKEKYSFLEWMQLAAKNPIIREEVKPVQIENPVEPALISSKETDLKKKKLDLIDQFIKNNPKIVPNKDIPIIAIDESVKINKNELMTATLAKVYLEQKKYKKAIQAFKILSLKYPEKSSFFASQINAVQKIQKENK